jgi:hypothetical protein
MGQIRAIETHRELPVCEKKFAILGRRNCSDCMSDIFHTRHVFLFGFVKRLKKCQIHADGLSSHMGHILRLFLLYKAAITSMTIRAGRNQPAFWHENKDMATYLDTWHQHVVSIQGAVGWNVMAGRFEGIILFVQDIHYLNDSCAILSCIFPFTMQPVHCININSSSVRHQAKSRVADADRMHSNMNLPCTCMTRKSTVDCWHAICDRKITFWPDKSRVIFIHPSSGRGNLSLGLLFFWTDETSQGVSESIGFEVFRRTLLSCLA